MNITEVRNVHDALAEADAALVRALHAAAGDVPPGWAVDIARARQTVYRSKMKSYWPCRRVEDAE